MNFEEEFRKEAKKRFNIPLEMLDDMKSVYWDHWMPVLAKHGRPDGLIDELTFSRGLACIALWVFAGMYQNVYQDSDKAMRKTKDIMEIAFDLMGPRGDVE